MTLLPRKAQGSFVSSALGPTALQGGELPCNHTLSRHRPRGCVRRRRVHLHARPTAGAALLLRHAAAQQSAGALPCPGRWVSVCLWMRARQRCTREQGGPARQAVMRCLQELSDMSNALRRGAGDAIAGVDTGASCASSGSDPRELSHRSRVRLTDGAACVGPSRILHVVEDAPLLLPPQFRHVGT